MTGRHWSAAGWTALGFLLAVALLIDPLGLHPFDELLRTGNGTGAPAANGVDREASEAGLWTCGMHPHVIEKEPGQCPICHMDLVPLTLADDAAVEDTAEPGSSEWSCPLHAQIREPEAGECPICGHELEQVPRDPTAPDATNLGTASQPAGPASTGVRIDPTVVQNMNVRTAVAERRDLRRPMRTVGYLEYDQERMVSVTTKYSGWVEKVHVNHVGEPVKKGQPLFEIYSPELVQTQQELLSALEFARRMAATPAETHRRAEALVAAARTRLGYWDISAAQIEELERTGEVLRTLTVRATAGGVVMQRMPGLEGMAVQPGMEIFHLANLQSLWLSVEIFEHQVAWVREGTPAEITMPYFPGRTFRGTVRFLEPEFSEQTRTLRVKIEVPNRDGELRKGMFATVVFEPLAVADAIAVPTQAILRTGQRNVVVVALGGGRFAPREVTVGHEAEGWSEILQGLDAGEELVVSAQFLLDSESKLREAIRKMIAGVG